MDFYEDKIAEVIKNLSDYHDAFHEKSIFSGPSLYFHCKSVHLNKMGHYDDLIEAVYATLASWGMHRMGERGAKMASYKEYRNSLLDLREDILSAQRFDENYSMDEEDWRVIERIYRGIRVMDGQKSNLVGKSKVMAHFLPGIIAPIDRQYTLKFLDLNLTSYKTEDEEWGLMREITERFFIRLSKNSELQSFAKNKIKKGGFDSENLDSLAWDTSLLKLIDNLVIGAGLLKGKIGKNASQNRMKIDAREMFKVNE